MLKLQKGVKGAATPSDIYVYINIQNSSKHCRGRRITKISRDSIHIQIQPRHTSIHTDLYIKKLAHTNCYKRHRIKLINQSIIIIISNRFVKSIFLESNLNYACFFVLLHCVSCFHLLFVFVSFCITFQYRFSLKLSFG